VIRLKTNPVLLVPGYGDPGGWVMKIMANRLRKNGYQQVEIIKIFTPGSIRKSAHIVKERVEWWTQNGAKKVSLIGYSEGGVVIRYYLQTFGGTKVDRAIYLATPHSGTWRTLLLFFTKSGRQMLPKSKLTKKLKEISVNDVPQISIFSLWDSIVPLRSGYLDEATNIFIVWPPVHHFGFLVSHTVFKAVAKALTDGHKKP
jgi:triacylglycerol lipase